MMSQSGKKVSEYVSKSRNAVSTVQWRERLKRTHISQVRETKTSGPSEALNLNGPCSTFGGCTLNHRC